MELGSVSRLLQSMRKGSDDAVTALWDRYFVALCQKASEQLRNTPRSVADEEDVVLAAFYSVCNGVREGRFQNLSDRGDFWQILVAITVRKAIDQQRHLQRKKRGAGKVHEPGLQNRDDEAAIREIIDDAPTPEVAAMFAEESRHLFEELGDDELRRVALLRMEGYSNQEIADRLGCVPRTVIRKVKLIGQILQARMDEEGPEV